MPPTALPNFNGAFYTTRWPIAACDQAINLYSETRQHQGSPKKTWTIGTPGQKFVTTLSGRNRGWWSQDGQTFTVSGTTLYQRNTDGTYTAITGTIPDDGYPCSFASNGLAGDQLGIVGGGQLAVYNLVSGGALSIAVLPFSNPVMIVFQDGYALVNQLNTPTFWFSELENFLSWDALDFATRSNTSDNIVGLAGTRDRIFVIGSKTTTLYFDSGNADNPWLPYPGTTAQVGCDAWTTISVYNDIVRWIGSSRGGEPKVVQTRADMNVQVISTPPINDILAGCSKLSDAEHATYEQSGHVFVIWTLPSAQTDVKSYHFDATESQLTNQSVWGARAGFDTTTGNYTRWRVRGVVGLPDRIMAGDYANGNIYELDLLTFADNGTILPRDRILPYLSTGNQWIFINGVELSTQPGSTTLLSGQGTTPQVDLQFSPDGTKTWSDRGLADLGVQGDYLARTLWMRCGRYREDRMVVRVRQTDPAPCVWIDLLLDVEQGTGQLV